MERTRRVGSALDPQYRPLRVVFIGQGGCGILRSDLEPQARAHSLAGRLRPGFEYFRKGKLAVPTSVFAIKAPEHLRLRDLLRNYQGPVSAKFAVFGVSQERPLHAQYQTAALQQAGIARI